MVIDLSTSANIDLAGVRMLSELDEQVAQAGASLVLAEVHGDVRDLLHAEGLETRIPGIAQRMSIASPDRAKKASTPGGGLSRGVVRRLPAAKDGYSAGRV